MREIIAIHILSLAADKLEPPLETAVVFHDKDKNLHDDLGLKCHYPNKECGIMFLCNDGKLRLHPNEDRFRKSNASTLYPSELYRHNSLVTAEIKIKKYLNIDFIPHKFTTYTKSNRKVMFFRPEEECNQLMIFEKE